MAHFAELNENNIVLRTVVINNDCCLDAEGNEQESIGAAFCTELLGGSRWIQTSYNGSFRKNFAGKGCIYDEQRDAFVSQKPPAPHDDYILDEETCMWVPPIPYPGTPGEDYYWDANEKAWIALDPPVSD